MLMATDIGVRAGGESVIEHLSVTVRRGEILTVLGPNGAGKTVLLRTLLGRMPHTGTVTWAPDARVGYVPQRLPYIRDLPVSVGDFFDLKSRGTDTAGLLQSVGLDASVARQRMGVLSSGQFQRVLIAWALAGDTNVLLFDEPTAGIDVAGEDTVYRLLGRLHQERGLTMLLVTHDLAIAYHMASTVLCLSRGTICQGTPAEVLTPETLARMYGPDVKYHLHAT